MVEGKVDWILLIAPSRVIQAALPFVDFTLDEIDIDVSKVNELSILLDNIVCSDVDNPFFHIW